MELIDRTEYRWRANTAAIGELIGRLMIELFSNITPKTAENFRQLCTGETRDSQGRPQGYKNCKFHRVVCACWDGFLAVWHALTSNSEGKDQGFHDTRGRLCQWRWHRLLFHLQHPEISWWEFYREAWSCWFIEHGCKLFFFFFFSLRRGYRYW